MVSAKVGDYTVRHLGVDLHHLDQFHRLAKNCISRMRTAVLVDSGTHGWGDVKDFIQPSNQFGCLFSVVRSRMNVCIFLD